MMVQREITATSRQVRIETRADALMGIDTGFCKIDVQGGALRVPGSHDTRRFGNHNVHVWLYHMPPGSMVRVVRGYRDGTGTTVVSSITTTKAMAEAGE